MSRTPEQADLPRKAEALEVTEVADGLVIYQERPERVHYLNPTASLVFELCTGQHTPDEIAHLLGGAFGLDAPPFEDVASSLEQLRSLGLIQWPRSSQAARD